MKKNPQICTEEASNSSITQASSICHPLDNKQKVRKDPSIQQDIYKELKEYVNKALQLEII